MRIKKTCLYIIFLIYFANGYAQVTKDIELVQGDRINEYFYEDTSYSGNIHLREDTVYAKLEDKLIKIIIEYNNGYKLRARGFYENGKLYKDVCFNKGKYNGYWISYYENGKIDWLIYYKNGKIIAPVLEFYENGNLLSILNTEKNSSKTWYSNGKLKSETIPIDSINEEAYITKHYYEQGQISSIIEYNLKKGVFTFYYENGKKWKEGFICNLELFQTGKWQEWYANGIKKREYYFDENTPNMKVGTWSWWNKEGNLIKQEIYKNNELIDTKEFIPMKIKKD